MFLLLEQPFLFLYSAKCFSAGARTGLGVTACCRGRMMGRIAYLGKAVEAQVVQQI